MIAIVAPGQGAQSPGMLAPWLELPGMRERVEHAADLVGLDLVRLGTEGSAEEITDTAVTQPLLAVSALLTARALGLLDGRPEGDTEVVVAGHSVGELPAAAVAGALTSDDAVRFAARRGAAMAAACALAPSTMAAVLGGDPEDTVAAIEKAGAVAANRNGAGQIVAAGSKESIEALVADPPAGARVRPLAVAGAFHTEYMTPAATQLRTWVDTGELVVTDPRRPMLSNLDGETVADGNDLLRRLVTQVDHPVRWDLCMEAMAARGVTTLIELAPGGTLTGIAKRAMKGVELVPVKSPADLDAARAALTSGSSS
ncbi:ACP S-malonyltransferase [Jatrophihabitans sp. YIM 134969]